MKIGIITPHFVPNYGAMLQAYALVTHLRATGHDAEVIDYRQPALAEYFRFKWQLPPHLKHWLRVRRCADFVSKHIPTSQRRFYSPDEFLPHVSGYDAFITGSDQVWFVGPVQYFDPLYFLEFDAPGKLKLSYAPSAGSSESFGQFEARAAAALRQFDHVSVRDAHTASLVDPLIGRDTVRVVDPVFLSDFSGLGIDESPEAEPYLLVFGDFNGDLAAHVAALRTATGLNRVITLQYPCAAASKRVAAPSPATWVRYFRHAAFVLTSYFHGTAFAVKFRRPFISIPTPGRRIKVDTLLRNFGLEKRCFLERADPRESARKAGEVIAWDESSRRLDRQINDSRAFLEHNLRNKGINPAVAHG